MTHARKVVGVIIKTRIQVAHLAIIINMHETVCSYRDVSTIFRWDFIKKYCWLTKVFFGTGYKSLSSLYIHILRLRIQTTTILYLFFFRRFDCDKLQCHFFFFKWTYGWVSETCVKVGNREKCTDVLICLMLTIWELYHRYLSWILLQSKPLINCMSCHS